MSAPPFDWTKINSNPICSEVRQALLGELRRCRRPAITGDKHEVIRDFVQGRHVLDLGVVEHTTELTERPEWLHGKIKNWAAEVLGVDILEHEVALLRERGYDVVTADATSDIDLGRRFERVVMGDLLEHVNDPVKLLKFALRHLAPGGYILATTPNPFYYAWIYESIRLGACIANAEHVTWTGPTMALEIARRAGVRLREYRLLRLKGDGRNWRTRFVDILSERFFREQELFAHTLVYVFEEAQGELSR